MYLLERVKLNLHPLASWWGKKIKTQLVLIFEVGDVRDLDTTQVKCYNGQAGTSHLQLMGEMGKPSCLKFWLQPQLFMRVIFFTLGSERFLYISWIRLMILVGRAQIEFVFS